MDGAKVALGAVAAFVGLLLVGVVLHLTGVYVFGGVQRSTADYRGETDVIEKTQADGDYRIQAYERFFNLCNGIAGQQANIQNLQDELDSGDADAQREAWLQNTIAGMQANLNNLISSYNADAAKEGTRGQFRDSDLPYSINLNPEETVKCD